MNEKCFGLRKGRECAVLESGICHGNYNTCPFYKPKWKSDRDRERALHHIAGKPLEEQQEIDDQQDDDPLDVEDPGPVNEHQEEEQQRIQCDDDADQDRGTAVADHQLP